MNNCETFTKENAFFGKFLNIEIIASEACLLTMDLVYILINEGLFLKKLTYV